MAIHPDQIIGRCRWPHPLPKELLDGGPRFDRDMIGEPAAEVVNEKNTHRETFSVDRFL